MSASSRLHLRFDDSQRLVGQWLAGIGRAEIGAEVEHVVLDACQHRIEPGQRRVGRGRQAGEADGAVGLVNRAVGFDAQIILAAPLARPERGRAGVAGLGVDAVENDHAVTDADGRKGHP